MLITRPGKARQEGRRQEAHEARPAPPARRRARAAPPPAPRRSRRARRSRWWSSDEGRPARRRWPASSARAVGDVRRRRPRAAPAELAAPAARRGAPAGWSRCRETRTPTRRHAQELHGRVGRVGGDDLAEREHAARPRARAASARLVGARRPARTTTKPMPRLNVRRISSARDVAAARRCSRTAAAAATRADRRAAARAPVGQHARRVVDQAAAGDVGRPAQQVGVGQRAQRPHVDPRRREQRLADRRARAPAGARRARSFVCVEEHPPRQRVAVGVEARRGQPEHRRRRWMSRPSTQRAAARRRRRRSRPGRTRPRRRSPGSSAVSPPSSAQPACRQPSAMPGDHAARRRRRPACRRRSSRGRTAARRRRQAVVDAHGDQVDADRVVPPGQEGQLELGADAVGARHQQRLAVAAWAARTGRRSRPDRRCTSGRMRALHVRLDALDQLVARVDVDAGVAVGESVAVVWHRGVLRQLASPVRWRRPCGRRRHC